jgi:D-beta-D-heptose 7-phosphate kinase/D-beta-D-heptose 1-phosphate adenosyltransferase
MSTQVNIQSPRILVVGDVMLDYFYDGITSRISPEAPVPVVNVKNQYVRLGGAANVAANIKALGGRVSLIGFIGQDVAGEELKSLLQVQGIDDGLIKVPDCRTITKLRVMSRNQQMVRLDQEDDFEQANFQMLVDKFREALIQCQLIVFSDYAKGTLKQIEQLIDVARAQNKPILVDPKGINYKRYAGANLVTPNMSEFEAVTGKCLSELEMVSKAQKLKAELELDALLITRSEQGMSLFDKSSSHWHIPTVAREVFDVTGAGDTVIATLAVCLALGEPLRDAVEKSNIAAGIAVGKVGTALVTFDEIQTFAQSNAQIGTRAKILKSFELTQWAARQKEKSRVIVMTNGCFDILHPGHIDYLENARSMGDCLVVAVNSDSSVTNLKGPERPILPLEVRLRMLSSLECVSVVVDFDSETPLELIRQVLPNILVKGGDYEGKFISGADPVIESGGEVRLVPFVEGFSSSNLIEKIKKSYS